MQHRINRTRRLYAPTPLPRCSSVGDIMHMRLQRHFIRQWRKAKGWTQERLAEASDVPQYEISRVENGKKPYDEELLERIALAMNVTPADLIMRDPSDPEGLWSIYDQLSDSQRTELVEIAQVMKRRNAA